MPFSFDQTIAIINNAANELSRAARDLGDEQPESEITQRLRDTLDEMTYCVSELTAMRDQAAARGTSGADVVVLRDVQRDPNGMASPGADLPAGVDAKTIEKDQAGLEKQREQEAERARLAAAQTTVTPVTIVDPAATTAKLPDVPKEGDNKRK